VATESLVAPRGRPPRGPRAFLFLVVDALAPLAAPARVALDGVTRVTIGRGARAVRRVGSEVTIGLPESTVSTTHAVLEPGPTGGWSLSDRSKNGTLVDGAPAGTAVLADGALIEVGHAFLRLRTGLPASPGKAEIVQAAELRPAAEGLRTLAPAVERLHQTIELVAQSTVPVLLHGETGSGKEVLARALHALSCRSGAFVAVNCAAIPAALVESELFGHRKGAFSGATEDRPGLIRAAHRGTLFLDEIGDLPLPAQAALLRAVQEREVLPVGATQPVPVDLRVVAASHQRLGDLVAAQKFRADLEGRLSGLEVTTVPLRERLEDLGILVAAILRRAFPAAADAITFERAAVLRLFQHGWPKNVRELEQALVAAAVLAGAERQIREEHLPRGLGADPPARAVPAHDLRADLERLLVAERGSVSAVAERLGRSRRQVQRYLRRFGLDAQRYRG
jgi:transcriptional regulator with PAS, ATPase and Fis domain